VGNGLGIVPVVIDNRHDTYGTKKKSDVNRCLIFIYCVRIINEILNYEVLSSIPGCILVQLLCVGRLKPSHLWCIYY